MDFFTVLAFGISLYCLYEVSEMSKKKKSNGIIEQETKKLLHERIQLLVGRRGEIILKQPLLFVDIAYTAKGMIIDVDNEWVLISVSKGKKEIKKLIRVSIIKDVKEIL